VISLKFESGLKLVYKPKDIELEQAWSELLNWFNEKGLKPDLKPLNVIPREGYGWAGFIETAECRSEQEVADYYRRIGSLIGIIYLLNGNDCHNENLIASGAYPMLIDLESVMHHEAKAFADENADNAMFFARKQLGASVFPYRASAILDKGERRLFVRCKWNWRIREWRISLPDVKMG